MVYRDISKDTKDLVFRTLNLNGWFDITPFEAAERLAEFGIAITPDVLHYLRVLSWSGFLTESEVKKC